MRGIRDMALGAFVLLMVLAVPSWAGGTAERQPATPSGQQATDPAAQRAALQKALGSNDLPSFLAAIDADRLLLAEVRKDLPDKRSDADAYLKRLKQLAARSDATSLVPKVDRLIEQEPTYYDWVEKNNAAQNQNANQSANEFAVSGARGFVVAFQDFQNALLLVVINRLEIAEHALQALAPASAS